MAKRTTKKTKTSKKKVEEKNDDLTLENNTVNTELPVDESTPEIKIDDEINLELPQDEVIPESPKEELDAKGDENDDELPNNESDSEEDKEEEIVEEVEKPKYKTIEQMSIAELNLYRKTGIKPLNK